MSSMNRASACTQGQRQDDPHLERLRDLGNTVIVVEHDEETIRAADWLVEIGPGPGVHGGEVVAQGPPASSPGDATFTDRRVSARRASKSSSRKTPRRRASRHCGFAARATIICKTSTWKFRWGCWSV